MMLSSPTGSSWMKVSPLEVLITRACDPSLHEPNYAVHLEVADYINSKKANNPREAAMLLARLANNRNPHIAILALALLDTLVQSCGYPFHLQIATKEFLNELVRRFPERPPPFPGPVMSRILELIHGWKEGICVESRWKEDLGNIRDMHRLLTFKGYRFRELPRRESNIATASAANLKTADELEAEDREAQSAKLQELIRRGTPRDLAAAQELMKALAGADPDSKPDYRSQALTEMNKLEQKVILLNEMLDNVDVERKEKFVTGDVYDQVSSILVAARPKIQKWISDAEGHDSESLDTFLQINDQINTVLGRYEAYKKGDFATASNPIPAELGPGQNILSLIDFDEGPSASSSAPSNSGADDLSGLFSSAQPQPAGMPVTNLVGNGGTNFGMGMNIQDMGMGAAMGGSMTSSIQTPTPIPFNHGGSNVFSIGGPLHPSSVSPPQLSNTPPAAIMLPSTPGNSSPGPSTVRPGSGLGKAPAGMGMGMGMVQQQQGMGTGIGAGQYQQRIGLGMSGIGMGMPQMQPQHQQSQSPFLPQQQQQQPPSNTPQVQGKDPFADLAGLF